MQVNQIKLKKAYADFIERIENEKNIQCDFGAQANEDSIMQDKRVVNIEGHKVFVKFNHNENPDPMSDANAQDQQLLSSDSNFSIYRGFSRPYLNTLKKPQSTVVQSPASNSQRK